MADAALALRVLLAGGLIWGVLLVLSKRRPVLAWLFKPILLLLWGRER